MRIGLYGVSRAGKNCLINAKIPPQYDKKPVKNKTHKKVKPNYKKKAKMRAKSK